MTNSEKTQIWNKILIFLSIYFMGVAFLFNSAGEIAEGFMRILFHPSLLLSDYMAIGNVGAAFFNVGLILFIGTVLVIITKTEVSGVIIAGLINAGAFAFLGKNLYNTVFLFLGVILHTFYKKRKVSEDLATAFFSLGIAPIISFITFSIGYPRPLNFIIAILTGLAMGFFLPPVSQKSPDIHEGYNLYNNGLALGLVSIIFYSFYKSFGHVTIIDSVLMEGRNTKILLVFLVLFFAMMASKLVLKDKGIEEYRLLLKRTGRAPSNFIADYSVSTVLFNMGLLGLIGLIYIYAVDGDLNGVTLGGVMALVAFGGMGKHPRNCIPIMLGVGLGSLLTTYDISSSAIVIAALFGTTIAPIAGDFGFILGIIAGYVHLLLVTNMGLLHGNLLLYNNGFTGGIVASVLVNIYRGIIPAFYHKD